MKAPVIGFAGLTHLGLVSAIAVAAKGFRVVGYDVDATRVRNIAARHLPVVEESGKPLGVLSARGVVDYLVEHFPSTIYCLPPDPDVVPLQREGA